MEEYCPKWDFSLGKKCSTNIVCVCGSHRGGFSAGGRPRSRVLCVRGKRSASLFGFILIILAGLIVVHTARQSWEEQSLKSSRWETTAEDLPFTHNLLRHTHFPILHCECESVLFLTFLKMSPVETCPCSVYITVMHEHSVIWLTSS